VNELLGYVFSPLREGDIALCRGSGNGLAPILLLPRKKRHSVASSSSNTNLRSRPNLTLSGRRDRSR